MAVGNDPAWEKYRSKLDKVVEASDWFNSLPEGHPDKKAAWDALMRAKHELGQAANEIEPKFRG